MTPSHHPLPETLISYAAGTLPNAVACVVACHLTMCRDCAENARRFEILGGLMLERLETASVDHARTEDALAQWSAERTAGEPAPDQPPDIEQALIPPPLADYIGTNGGEVPWETIVNGMQQYRIGLPQGSGQMRLLQLRPGQRLPKAPRTTEVGLALVLQGAVTDETGDFLRGDVIEWTEETGLQPRAAGEVDCICLVASDAEPAALAMTLDELRRLGRKAAPSRRQLREIWTQPASLAASVALLLGIGVGWLLHGGPESGAIGLNNLISIEDGRLLARGPLQEVLNSLPSSAPTAAIPNDGELRLGIKMTFQDQDGDYCRQYRIAAISAARYSGVACRMGEEWVVKVQALVPPSPSATNRTIPAGAGGDVAMDAVVRALIAGDPVVGEDEAAIMNKGWKK
jgi:putative transcriptional regulator